MQLGYPVPPPAPKVPRAHLAYTWDCEAGHPDDIDEYADGELGLSRQVLGSRSVWRWRSPFPREKRRAAAAAAAAAAAVGSPSAVRSRRWSEHRHGQRAATGMMMVLLKRSFGESRTPDESFAAGGDTADGESPGKERHIKKPRRPHGVCVRVSVAHVCVLRCGERVEQKSVRAYPAVVLRRCSLLLGSRNG